MIEDIVRKHWDAIVIGTGMGGGMVGRRLAERGLHVLFLDRGLAAGARAAETSPAAAGAGYWPHALQGLIDDQPSTHFGVLGSVVGGTSVNYAASLERPERHDLDDGPERPHPTGGWPVGFDAYQPHFQAVASMFEVCGDADPLSSESALALAAPPPMNAGDESLFRSFQEAGLHPYRSHLGIRYLPGCTECLGRACPRACKLDARTAGVEPAIATGRAALIDGCEVTTLRGGGGRVTHIEARRGGESLTLSAHRIVLSAGGLASPRLLLASASEAWPKGCANESGLVGRNLMFHVSERVAVWPNRRETFGKPVKAMSLRDFYFRDGMRFGLLQSMGLEARYGELLHYLNGRFERSSMRSLRGSLRIPAFATSRILGPARVFVGILEDMPVLTNRVVLDAARPQTIRFEYRHTTDLFHRRRHFRTLVRTALHRHRLFFLDHAPGLNLAHPCGTLRFGVDPSRSVLDPSCRAHRVENLYVADSSFMPTSTGVNPSLTIAANALRVADRIAATFAAIEPAPVVARVAR